MSGSFDNLPRLQTLDEGEYGKISAGLRPPHSIFTFADMPTLPIGFCFRGQTGPGEVNCHFRQLTIAGNFRTRPAAPAFENCWHATNSAPREHKTFDSLNFLCV